jgi:hypothetical protein
VGKANWSRERVTDGVPTTTFQWWARREERLCPPYKLVND